MFPCWSTRKRSQSFWRLRGRDMYLPGGRSPGVFSIKALKAAALSAPRMCPADSHLPLEFRNRKSKCIRASLYPDSAAGLRLLPEAGRPWQVVRCPGPNRFIGPNEGPAVPKVHLVDRLAALHLVGGEKVIGAAPGTTPDGPARRRTSSNAPDESTVAD